MQHCAAVVGGRVRTKLGGKWPAKPASHEIRATCRGSSQVITDENMVQKSSFRWDVLCFLFTFLLQGSTSDLPSVPTDDQELELSLPT